MNDNQHKSLISVPLDPPTTSPSHNLTTWLSTNTKSLDALFELYPDTVMTITYMPHCSPQIILDVPTNKISVLSSQLTELSLKPTQLTCHPFSITLTYI